ncbi:hypothetical protein JCM11491_002711 [Sporobolomyces phaffii]
MLGASTKNYKTYGKRKTNIVNKRVVLGDSNSTNNPRHPARRWSDSDSDESHGEDTPVRSRPAQAGARKVVVVNSVSRNVSRDKENATTTPDRPTRTTTTPACRDLEEDDSSSEEASDLPRRVPLRKKAQIAPPQSKIASIVVSSDDEAQDDDSIDIVEAQNENTRVEQLVLDTEEEEEASPESEPESVVTADNLESRAPALSSLPFPVALEPLVASTSSPDAPKPYDFTSFVACPPAPFSVPSTVDAPWRKVGEASYSEVFSTTSVDGHEIVVKIIPVAPPPDARRSETGTGGELPNASESEAVKREIEISRWLGADTDRAVDGFVRFKGAFLVQGRYPSSLLCAWDRFKVNQKPVCDDQIRPSVLPATQMYALIVLDHGGVDLEAWKLRDWREAKEIWDQIVEHLGLAEREFEFEHRDLHLGNILIAPAPPPPSRTLTDDLAAIQLTPRTSDPAASPTLHPTVRTTLIDFTLSRMLEPRSATATSSNSRRSKGKTASRRQVLFDAFDDECIFEGEGDSQFDVYRGMRTIVERDGGGWEAFHPRTNLLWLHYLVRKLLEAKRLKPPSLPAPAPSLGSSTLASPGRPVPSPRKTRRHSVLFQATTAVPSSPLAATAQRRSRTLPNPKTALLSRQQRALSEKQRREMVQEVQAWGSLQRAESKLRDVLGDLVEGNGNGDTSSSRPRPKPRKNVGSKGGKASSKKVASSGGDALETTGAADFWTWSNSN